MKRSIGIAIVLTVACFSGYLYSQGINFIIGKELNFSFSMGNCMLKLNRDMTYIADYGSEGTSWYNVGAYKIDGTRVVLTPSQCSHYKDGIPVECARTLGNATCTVQDDTASLHYTKFLSCKSRENKNVLGFMFDDTVRFPLEEFRLGKGEERKYDDVNVISMGFVKGITTANVKLREKPSVSSKVVEYLKNFDIYDFTRELKFVPVNTEVVIIARTKDAHAVEKSSNYWYLVNVGANSDVWMFGEFVKIK